MFRTVPLSIIRSFSLYAQQCYMSYRFADSLRAGSGRNVLILLAVKLSANLYDICHCCVYSEKLLMMGRGTVLNMQNFISKINLRNQCMQLVLLLQKLLFVKFSANVSSHGLALVLECCSPLPQGILFGLQQKVLFKNVTALLALTTIFL